MALGPCEVMQKAHITYIAIMEFINNLKETINKLRLQYIM